MSSPTGGVVDPFRAYQVSTSTGALCARSVAGSNMTRSIMARMHHGAADPIGAMEMDDVEQVGLEVYPAERFPAQ